MLPISQQRAIWLSAAPELAPLLAIMPEIEGRLTIYQTPASGGLLLAVMLSDAKPDGPKWWWHESLFLPSFERDLATRLSKGLFDIQRAMDTTPQMVTPSGEDPNVIPIAIYRRQSNTDEQE